MKKEGMVADDEVRPPAAGFPDDGVVDIQGDENAPDVLGRRADLHADVIAIPC
jgi:hypothetical protein